MEPDADFDTTCASVGCNRQAKRGDVYCAYHQAWPDPDSPLPRHRDYNRRWPLIHWDATDWLTLLVSVAILGTFFHFLKSH